MSTGTSTGFCEEKALEENSPGGSELAELKDFSPRKYSEVAELISAGQFRLAEKICKEKLLRDPADYVAMTQLGRVYWEKGKRRAAIKLFRKAVRIEPDYPITHFYLGKAYILEKKPKKGFAEFDVFQEKMNALVEMDEDLKDYYIYCLHYICYVYATQKHYKEAMKICKKIIRLDPDNQRAHYNLAVCYYIYKHNRSRAYTELTKVIEIDKATRMADRAKFYIDYMRRNPDSRTMSDFTFLEEY